MRYRLNSNKNIWNNASRIGIVLALLLLTCVLFSACDANCNGVDNCNNNNSEPSGGGNTVTTTTQPPTTSSGPIAEGDFLYSPGSVTGPAIVEFWNGQSGANDVCGTFQLPSGESFNYTAGHWWKYKSDQDMQADWPLHLALYNQKPENAPCTRGQRPPA